MITSVPCPHCGKEIELTEALVHQITQHVTRDVEKQYQKELEEATKKAASDAQKKAAEQLSIELKDLQKQLEEKNAKVEKFQEEELKLRQEKRKLEEREKELSLEVARTIDAERKKIEESIQRKSDESHRLKEKEYEKKLEDMTRALEEAKRKAQQGSQQLQGEVLELDLETLLRELFPADAIEPVGKGIRGADISHTVKSPKGMTCGVILWESKRTKTWSDEWTVKLKEDLRASKAHIPVIVSSALPQEASSGIGVKDGVWVTSFPLVSALASLLRKNLLDVAYQKAIFAHQGEKADVLYEYITGHEFKQQVEAIVESYQEMQAQIIRERIAFEKSWKAREGQLMRLIKSTANVYGSLQGVIGASLPQPKGLELTDGEEEQRKLV